MNMQIYLHFYIFIQRETSTKTYKLYIYILCMFIRSSEYCKNKDSDHTYGKTNIVEVAY